MTSVWWPIPVRPSSWFTAEQLEASARYHRPLQRVAALRTVARFAGLGAASIACRNWLSANDAWLLRLVAGSALVTLAWWLPATVSDWWFDRYHEPRFVTPTSRPSLPAHQLMTGSLVAGLGVLLGLVVVGGTLFGLLDTMQLWWVLATPAVLLLAVSVSLVQQRLAIRARSLEPLSDDAELPFVDMARTAGVPGVSFWSMNSVLERGPNALTTNGARRSEAGPASHSYRVALTQELLDAPLDLQRVVVAHEVAHIQSGHLKKTMLAGALGLLVAWGVIAAALGDSSIWRAIAGVEPEDPRGMPALVLLGWVVGSGVSLVSAWLERVQERQADERAFSIASSVAGPVSGQAMAQLMRVLHATDRTDLDPGLLSRLLSAHPPPAERLHRAQLAAA